MTTKISKLGRERLENEVGFERIVEISPAFDKRHTDPSKNYGVHGADMRFVLKGPLGAIHFVIFTNWHLPHVREERMKRLLSEPIDRIAVECTFDPMPADVGYHSPTPQHDDHQVSNDSCEYLDGKPCYGDGSALAAENMFEVLVAEGSEGVWREMRGWYDECFIASTEAE